MQMTQISDEEGADEREDENNNRNIVINIILIRD